MDFYRQYFLENAVDIIAKERNRIINQKLATVSMVDGFIKNYINQAHHKKLQPDNLS